MMKLLLQIVLFGIATLYLPVVADARVVIPGTGDSQALLRQLAAEFQAKTGIKVLIPDSIGSFGGIKSVVDGKAKLGRVARPIKEKEQEFALHYRVFAYSPVVMVANQPDDCISNLTHTQLIDIFRGEISNWRQLQSCPAAKIYVATREPGDSSRVVLEKNIPDLRDVMGTTGKTVYTTPELIEVLENYRYTVGYAPLAMVNRRKLRVLSLDGVAPSAENVRNGSYPLTTPFALIWKGQLNGDEKRFFDYLFSSEVQHRIEELGLVPAQN